MFAVGDAEDVGSAGWACGGSSAEPLDSEIGDVARRRKDATDPMHIARTPDWLVIEEGVVFGGYLADGDV